MKNRIPSTWEAKFEGKNWRIFSDDGRLIATLTDAPDAEARARIIAMSPYMLEALKGTVELIGDEDLPDNGEVSGAAVCDLVRSAVTLAEES
jgi:hypothetical protein